VGQTLLFPVALPGQFNFFGEYNGFFNGSEKT
jgi:hypothetical protein